MAVEIAASQFWARLQRTVGAWRAAPGLFNHAAEMWVAIGKDDDERPDNLRITTMQNYLLGYEFPETVFIFRREKLEVWTSQRRCDILGQVVAARPPEFDYPLEPVVCNYKEEAATRARFEALVAGAAGPVGLLLKESKWQKGAFSRVLLDLAAAAASDGRLQAVDVANGWAEVLSVKDEVEIGYIRRSAAFTSSVYKKYTVAEIERVIDSSSEIAQSKLAQDTEAVIMEPKKKFSTVGDEFAQSVDSSFVPVIQSGGNYDLNGLYTCRAEVSGDLLSYDTIVVGLGSKFRQYCSGIARTLMVDAPPDQCQCYGVLESTHKHLLQAIKPGVTFAEVYNAVLKHVEEKAVDGPLAQLKAKLLPKLGYGVGLSVRDPYLEISATNDRVVKANMTLVVVTGFKDVQITSDDPKRQTVSLVLADTILICDKPREDGAYTELLTKSPFTYQHVSYTVTEEDGEGEGQSSGSEDAEAKAAKWKQTLRHKKGAAKSNAETRDAQQRKLLEQRRKESQGRRRTQEDEKKDFSTAGRLARGQLCSYATEREMPDVRGLYLDKAQDTLLIPLWGTLAPFHVSTIRNVTKSEEGDAIFLRFNFLIPSGGAQAYVPGTLFPNAVFVKEVTYRVHARQASKAEQVMSELSAAIKRIKAYDARQKESEGVVKQDALQVDRSSTCFKLRDVFMRPFKGRKQTGTLEGYKDGVRFACGGEQLDLPFSNVKHGIIHPANNDVICLVHFHLRKPIMVGTKKVLDVQFYVEVLLDEKLGGANMRRGTEEEEIAEETRQRDQIQKWNSEFLAWGQRIQSIANIRFETPFYKSDFTGNVNRSTQVIRKTTNCLVSLVEGPPFFVLTLEDVEICVLERVILGHKNFDVVFVNKDYKLGVTRIDTVEMQRLDEMKDWLTSVGIVFYEVPQPLAWGPIMKEVITQDSKEEWDPWSEEIGWSSFLDINTADSEESETDSEDSAFDVHQESDESTDEPSTEGDTSDEDFGEEEEDEEEESGTDWDEMEEQLGREDKQRNVSGSESGDSDDDSDARRKRRRAPPKPA
eukprot:EG_transcript_1723